MGFNTNKFISPLFKLFGKNLAGVPPSPTNLDIIQFNSTSNKWELASGVVGSAVQSSSNVGTGFGVALPRVLDDLPFKTFVGGTGITITVTPTEITISGSATVTKGKFVMGYHADKNWKATTTYGAMFTNKADEAVEAEAQGFFNFEYEVVEITCFVSNNTDVVGGTITLKRNSVAIPATTITIPALTTGKFSLSVTETFAIADEIHEEHTSSADNDIKNTSYYLECEALLI